MALFFFGMFFFRSANLGMLWFALSCLCAAAHYLIYESKQIMVFFPTLNWYLEHKVELLLNIYYFVFILLFAFSALQYRPKRWFSVVSWAVLGALSVFLYRRARAVLYEVSRACRRRTDWLYAAGRRHSAARRARAGKLRQADRWIVALSPLLTLAVYCIEGATYFSHIFLSPGLCHDPAGLLQCPGADDQLFPDCPAAERRPAPGACHGGGKCHAGKK